MWTSTAARFCAASTTRTAGDRRALTVVVCAAQGETQFAPREAIPLEPSAPHPRSLFAVYRRGSEKAVHCREGHCARKILSIEGTTSASDWAACRVSCCCSALALVDVRGNLRSAMEHLQDDDLQHHFDMALGATLLSHGAPPTAASIASIAPSLAHRMSDARDRTDIDWTSSRMVSLCAKLDVSPPTHLASAPVGSSDAASSSSSLHRRAAAARLLLTSEESESVWYYSILLQDEEMHSHRAITKLKEIDSLKVLMTVCSVRQHATQPSDHLGAHHRSTRNPSVPLPPQEVYQSVLAAVTKRKCAGGDALGVPRLPPGDPKSKLSCVDLAIAYTMRAASPSSCLQFLCSSMAVAHSSEMPGWFLAPELILALAREQLQHVQSPQTTTDVAPVALAEWIVALGAVLSSHHASKTPLLQRHAMEVMQDFLGKLLLVVSDPISGHTSRSSTAGTIGRQTVGRVDGSGAAVEATSEDASPLAAAQGFVPLVQQIIAWQAAPPSWVTQDLSGTLSIAVQAMVKWVAQGNDTAAIRLLRQSKLMDPLAMRRFVIVTVPLIASLGREETMTEVLSAVVADSALLYTGGYHSDDLMLPVFTRAVAMKRAALVADEERSSRGATLVGDDMVLDAILTDFALLGKLILRQTKNASEASSHAASTTDCPSSTPHASTKSIDPDAALLGGPVQFFRYLVQTSQDVWSDMHRLLRAPLAEDGDSSCAARMPPHDAAAPSPATAGDHGDSDDASRVQTMGIVVPAAIQRSYTNLLERVVRAAMQHNRMERPLCNAELARTIEHAIRLPNLHDEYRQKLFLMVNVAPSASVASASSAASPERSAAGRGGGGADTVSPGLQKLTGALPLQFLPWASIQIAKDVLGASSGHSPQFVHLLQTTVDLQLPPSTARSRVAGVLQVYKLIRSQRDKVSMEEYTRLMWRCFVSLPLSYFLSSWTFFTWWMFVGTLVLLHVTGWSWEAVYVVDSCRRMFAQDLGIDRDGSVCLPVDATRSTSKAAHRPAIDGLSAWLNNPQRHHHAVAKCLVVATSTASDVGEVAMQLCQTLDPATASPFVLRCAGSGSAGSSGGVVVVDDVVRDAAQRIRKASNTTRNPFKRLLFNLFPLFREDAELALIDLTARQAASKKVPFTFFLLLPAGTQLSASAYQSLVHTFARRYVSSLVVVIPGCQTLHITKFLAPMLPSDGTSSGALVPAVALHGTADDDDDDAISPCGLLYPCAPPPLSVRIVDADAVDRATPSTSVAGQCIAWQSLPLFDGRHLVVASSLHGNGVGCGTTMPEGPVGLLVARLSDFAAQHRLCDVAQALTGFVPTVPDALAVRQTLVRTVDHWLHHRNSRSGSAHGGAVQWVQRVHATEHTVTAAVVSTARGWAEGVRSRLDALKK